MSSGNTPPASPGAGNDDLAAIDPIDYARRVAAVVKRPLGHQHEDVVQDAVVHVLTRLRQAREGTARIPAGLEVGRWLYNRCVGDLRDQYKPLWRAAARGIGTLGIGYGSSTAPFDTTTRAADHREPTELDLTLDIQNVIADLSPTQQLIVSAYYFRGRSEPEIAASRGMSQPAVSQVLRRARKLIAEYLSNASDAIATA